MTKRLWEFASHNFIIISQIKFVYAVSSGRSCDWILLKLFISKTKMQRKKFKWSKRQSVFWTQKFHTHSRLNALSNKVVPVGLGLRPHVKLQEWFPRGITPVLKKKSLFPEMSSDVSFLLFLEDNFISTNPYFPPLPEDLIPSYDGLVHTFRKLVFATFCF